MNHAYSLLTQKDGFGCLAVACRFPQAKPSEGPAADFAGFRLSIRDAIRDCRAPRVQSTYNIVECRDSILGIVIMLWKGIPHNST